MHKITAVQLARSLSPRITSPNFYTFFLKIDDLVIIIEDDESFPEFNNCDVIDGAAASSDSDQHVQQELLYCW